MTRKYWLGALLGLFATSACGDDTSAMDGDETGTTGMEEVTTTGVDASTGTDPSTTMPGTTTMTTELDSSTTADPPPPPDPADFLLRIENISGSSILPTTISPGVWLEQDQDANPPIYQTNAAALPNGLRELAEDGDPTVLAASLQNNFELEQSGVFETAVDGDGPGPIGPGEAYEVTFTAQPFSRLGLATMFGATNDTFIATAPQGVALFFGNGQPHEFRDITEFLLMLDAGTEANQAPGQGPDQGAFQDAAGQGARESGAVTAFSSSTRAVPLPAALVEVSVELEDGTYTIELTNVSETRGTLVTALSPLVWALHDDRVALFEPGAPAPDGLEALAEDGDPTALVAALEGSVTVGATADAVAPGESFVLVVTPEAGAPLLSFATMVAETNDAFIAPLPSGIALLDAQGQPRTATAVANDIRRNLAVWDAGTEANEVPGVGPNQAPRQEDPDTGPADEDPNVRLYADLTNDLAGPSAGGFLGVEIVQGDTDDEFVVTITNTSETTVYPGLLSPVVWAVHDDTVYLFEEGMTASPALEELAEDGDPAGLLGELAGMSGVLAAEVVDEVEGEGVGPLLPGQSYSFTISGVNADERYFSFAGMIQPSNDTFAAFGPQGIALWDDQGPLADEDIATSIAAALRAWDAGTEANQAGAAGRDQAPQQPAAGAGAPEGTGLVRNASTDPNWAYPEVASIVRITVERVR